jgi:hypothetical protein
LTFSAAETSTAAPRELAERREAANARNVKG